MNKNLILKEYPVLSKLLELKRSIDKFTNRPKGANKSFWSHIFSSVALENFIRIEDSSDYNDNVDT